MTPGKAKIKKKYKYILFLAKKKENSLIKRLSTKMPRKRWQKATVVLGLIRKNSTSGSQMTQLVSLQV